MAYQITDSNNVYTSINGNSVIDGCTITINNVYHGEDIYFITHSDLGNSATGAFPVLVVDNVAKQFMRLRIDSCHINVRSDTTEDYPTSHTFTISCANHSNELSRITSDSYLFIHVRWLTVRVSVTSVPSVTENNGIYSVSLNVYGEIHKEKLNYIKTDDIVLDIVNPSATISEIDDNCYIRTGNTISYKSSAQHTSFKIANQGTLLEITASNNLTFSGICFRNNGIADITYKSYEQAEHLSVPCVKIENCNTITFENCTFYGIMGYCIAVGITSQCYNIQFLNCYVYDSFGGGFLLDKACYSTINNCLIKNYGLVQQGSVGILLKNNAHNCNITHNTIHDGYYTGISVGWSWGYGDTNCHHNTISYNHIHHCMKMLSNDGGGIYTLGKSEGTVIERNVIHDIVSRSANDSSAIYLDEGTSYIKCRNNICYGCDRAFHIHYGYANEISNNIFAFCNNLLFKYSDPKRPHTTNVKTLAFYAHDNIFHIDSGEFMLSPQQEGIYFFSHNLLDDTVKLQDLSLLGTKLRLLDFHFGSIRPLVGQNGPLIFTKFGLKGTTASLIQLSINNFIICNTVGSGFNRIDITDTPALCGVSTSMKTQYDSDESNAVNFENQRQAVANTFPQNHSSYFNE